MSGPLPGASRPPLALRLPDRPVNNWTAVCNAGVAGAAIYLEPDAARLAEILARAARSLDDYLSTFDEDGGSTKDQPTGLTGSATTPSWPTSWDTARAGRWTSSKASTCAGSHGPIAHQAEPGPLRELLRLRRERRLHPSPPVLPVAQVGPARPRTTGRRAARRRRAREGS